MFLKTQKDIDELLEKYPLENHIIEIQEGERVDFESLREHGKIRLHLDTKYYINKNKGFIFLKTNSTHNIEYLHRDGNTENKIEDWIETYKYSEEGILVLNIIKKVSKDTDSELEDIILVINGIDVSKQKDDVRKLYIKIGKFLHHYNRIKKQYFVLRNTEVDFMYAQNNWSFDYESYYQFFTESQSSHFGLYYRRLLDVDSDLGKKISIQKIINIANGLGIISFDSKISLEINGKMKTKKIKAWLIKFQEFNNHINTYISHNDESTFEERINVTRTSNTTTSTTESIMHPTGIFKKLDELILFIDSVMSTYFLRNPQLHNFGEDKYKIHFIKK